MPLGEKVKRKEGGIWLPTDPCPICCGYVPLLYCSVPCRLMNIYGGPAGRLPSACDGQTTGHRPQRVWVMPAGQSYWYYVESTRCVLVVAKTVAANTNERLPLHFVAYT